MTMTTTEPIAVRSLAPIGLAELDRAAALRNRVDRKYVLRSDGLAVFTQSLASAFNVLEIDGRRTFTYRNVYFDTPELASYRAHVQRRRRRYKIRTREYVESGVRMIEVKLKGGRGETI